MTSRTSARFRLAFRRLPARVQRRERAYTPAVFVLERATGAAVSVLPLRQECPSGVITSPLLASVVAECSFTSGARPPM